MSGSTTVHGILAAFLLIHIVLNIESGDCWVLKKDSFKGDKSSTSDSINRPPVAPNRWCGARLSAILSVICDNLSDFQLTNSQNSDLPERRRLESKYSLVNQLNGRRKLSVVEQCCHKQCSLHDLRSYCFN